MLDFHLGTGGIENLVEHIGGLSAAEIYWLQRNDFLIQGKTGHLPDSEESLPYYDDVILTLEQLQRMYAKCILQLTKARETPGFQSTDVDKLRKILEVAIESESGLSTIAD